MDKRRLSPSKNRGKDRTTAPTRGIPFWVVRSVLGLVLMVAGALKLYELAFEGLDESNLTLLLIGFSEAELLGGIWMVGGFDPERTRWWAVAAFAGLAISSYFQARAGKCSCVCFGSLSVNPWFVLFFDVAAVAALLGSRPCSGTEGWHPADRLHFLGLGILALAIGTVGWRQADLVTVAGMATAGGRPLEEASLTFTGGSGKIVLRTDHDGNFRLPLVRPGLYAVSGPARESASMFRSGHADERLARKTTQRPRRQPAPQTNPSPANSPLWVEISNCSEFGKIIDFK